ncbi:nucleotidyltransferase family protein [Stenotrophomonas maltophilia]|nr:nucleotidyltransferase family protein [Stenotrophomonas maltophilia]
MTALFTFVGFMGSERILEAIGLVSPVVSSPGYVARGGLASGLFSFLTKARFDLILNFIVLLIFVASLMNLVFRWKERGAQHFNGVVRLRSFTRWLDEVSVSELSDYASLSRKIRQRYDSIIEVLPSNTDKDYREALKSMPDPPQGGGGDAEIDQPPESGPRQGVFISGELDQRVVLDFIRGSPITMEVMRVMSGISGTLWLGGGAVRSLVWNNLTGRSEDVHDYDVVYFDAQDISESNEIRILDALKVALPRSITLSVKNQARMHILNGEHPRYSIDGAIASWPERATSMAFQLSDQEIRFIAPYGFDDLLNLVVQPTPYHSNGSVAYRRRLSDKRWLERWPQLEVVSA